MVSVSSIVRALAGGGLRERNVRILCVGLLVSTLLVAPPFARAQQGGAETTPPASGPAPDARQKTLRYSRFRSMLRTGDSIGDIKTGNLCASQMLLVMNARTEQAVMAPASRAVREEFLKAGLSDPVRGQQKLFEEDADYAPVALLLGGMLEEFNTSYCSSGSGSHTDGRVRVKIRWEVFDTATRKVVLAKRVEGVYQTNGVEALREGEFFERAYRDAVRQLVTDPKFQEALIAVPPEPGIKPAAAAAGSKLVLKRTAPLSDALTRNMTLIRAAVVTINHPRGGGSGFFVSESGHVITNSHVVGDTRFVSVVLATGRELVGEVIQRDAARDVALIKTEGSNFAALAVSTEDINVGAEVVAIGSPLTQELSGTVTRGVVSGHRIIEGKRYIQSDVSILPGSSGGPLLDKSGRVVGVAVLGLGSARINFFVPIQEALSSLGIALAER